MPISMTVRLVEPLELHVDYPKRTLLLQLCSRPHLGTPYYETATCTALGGCQFFWGVGV